MNATPIASQYSTSVMTKVRSKIASDSSRILTLESISSSCRPSLSCCILPMTSSASIALLEIETDGVDAGIVKMPVIGLSAHQQRARVDVVALVGRDHSKRGFASDCAQRDDAARGDAIAVGIGLGYEHHIICLEPGPYVCRVRIEDLGAGVAARRHLDCEYLCAAAGVLMPGAAVGAVRLDAGQSRHVFDEQRVERTALHAGVDIRLQGLFQPGTDRAAKTVNHNADTNGC